MVGGILLCDPTEQVEPVDDYNTTESDNHLCKLSFEIGETEIVVNSNGVPNHDLSLVLVAVLVSKLSNGESR